MQLISRINETIINPLILLLLVMALLVFVWGAVQFVANASNEEGRSVGKRHMIWGVIGLFLMFSVLGILRVLLRTFDIAPPTGSGL